MTILQNDLKHNQFRHEALFYDGLDDWVERSASFVREGVETSEAVLVIALQDKLDALASALGDAREEVILEDMGEVGMNPARIIPRWRTFISEHGAVGRRVRGIGEPIWATRTADQLSEAHRHEALINLAFAGAPAWIVCQYDVNSLSDRVLEEAEKNHPAVFDGTSSRPSATFRGLEEISAPFSEPLGEPTTTAHVITITQHSLQMIRQLVAGEADAAGMRPLKKWDLVLAVNEVVTNSLRHGKGNRMLRLWTDASGITCEVSDDGRIEDPLLGRHVPGPDKEGGFGLWLVNQVCDLVQIRSFSHGSVVRLRMSTPSDSRSDRELLSSN